MQRIDGTIKMEEVTGMETEKRWLYVFAGEDRFVKMKASTKEDAQGAKEPIEGRPAVYRKPALAKGGDATGRR
jgi:hypothetical protein